MVSSLQPSAPRDGFLHLPSEHAESVVHSNPQLRRRRKQVVLCFDGTGNKFSGTDSDSNILKIYRMLDRMDVDQVHYYQPGIGTYVTSKSLTSNGRIAKLKSWYAKAKDSAIGSSFADHVMGGYKFLMRYYQQGDEVYFFGFSRGAYTARFLAEMLDHVGLLSQGNEEMARFAWKTFQKWQMRQENTPEEKARKKELLEFMCAFRETFSRPVHRIRFLGLFDTVNSVPRFENPWMQRSKFPYTARSTAKCIRHAVAIDERRAKFRQDLISQMRMAPEEAHYRRHLLRHHHLLHHSADMINGGHHVPHPSSVADEGQRRHLNASTDSRDHAAAVGSEGEDELQRGRRNEPKETGAHLNPDGVAELFRRGSETAGVRARSPGMSHRQSSASLNSMAALRHDGYDDESDEDETAQDIQEVWFAGCHADIGGGWPLNEGEHAALSHVPLVWMVREARRAGLRFDEEKLRALNCCPPDGFDEYKRARGVNLPSIAVKPASPDGSDERRPSNGDDAPADGAAAAGATAGNGAPAPPGGGQQHPQGHRFLEALHLAGTRGRMHDVLRFDNGVGPASVVSWNLMEYLPFRRMDLQADGSWKSIAWPLPKGEVRDVPDSVVVHGSVLRRMRADEGYRPGNLIVGGGGRGVRRAPPEYGMGEWVVLREEGDPVGEVYVRAKPSVRSRQSSKKSWGSK
ncbi:hypothetical protein BDY21DRAFT_392908 [Lineolata rhizophorae]|uniref:T6SS Phospholipase effector Tle1-like catalytic domain-containing protein n=1 Tax=Lineolata rhizophorae TaxID=578093 RepID=A0A6A6NY88_9PEZI|nr:hypothetical protein BDY21DRAFT_392908 [Lineolata rhizophorae]